MPDNRDRHFIGPNARMLLGQASLALSLWIGAQPPANSGDFASEIRPLLSDRCFKCHGPGEQKAGLRLDSRTEALRVIDLEHPDRSELFRRLTATDPDERMPPANEGAEGLNPQEVELIRSWITDGAPFKEHWAYVPPRKATVPAGAHPVDYFVRKRQQGSGVRANPRADAAVLLRRLSLDLIGLPPTVQEVDAFLADSREAGYREQVERLLTSPHFGEKWARGWLDLARYADSNGYQHDDLRTMWPWRDWVIRAFNRDLPFDQFTIEQLAGDLLPAATEDQLIATAFHRNTPANFSGGTKVEEIRAALLMDRVNVTGQVWLGATLECAGCHDHKFDPITQRDYYRLYAFFNQGVLEVDQEGRDMFRKRFVGATVKVPTIHVDHARAPALKAELAKLQARDDRLKNAPDRPKPDKERWAVNGRMKKIRLELARLDPAVVHVLKDRDAPMATRVFRRGNYLTPGAVVERGTIAALHPFPDDAPRDRLGLARWLVSRDNPLVARVAVNRWWAELFGRGIVETLDDFGMQSPPPSHPELLDWLAVDFMEHGWSLKHLLRTLVTSETYRQSAGLRADAAAKDPENRLLWRAPRFRLPAELVRDNALAISGLLNRKRFGPPVYPPQPDGLWSEIPGAEIKDYPTSPGADRHRRGIYMALRRGNPHPSLTNFDATDRSLCVARRARTNTPLQALTLLNDPNFVEAAAHFAKLIRGAPGDEAKRAGWAFRRALARAPDPAELAVLLSLQEADPTWFDVAQCLLNADETVRN